MRRTLFIAAVSIIATGVIGCRSAQLAYDQDHIRSAVMDLETNQIMDNLIRCRQGLPFLHLDYIHMTGTVTNTASGTLGGSQTSVNSKSLQGPTTALAFIHTFTNLFTWNAAGSKVNQLTLTAEPVTSAPEVYTAYMQFLKDPAHLMKTDEPPPADLALITRERPACGGTSCQHWKRHHVVYYWVPCEFRDDFRRLSLYTIALRGQPVSSSPNFSVTILGFNSNDVKNQRGPGFTIGFKIDKKIPNGRGYMIATINGTMYNYPASQPNVLVVSEDVTKPLAVPGRLDDDMLTDELRLRFNLNTFGFNTVDELLTRLANQKVSIHMADFAPSGTPVDRALEDIRYQLELNRLNQFPIAFP